MEAMRVTYRSPRHKLVSFFERSRNNWKAKYGALKAKVKNQTNRISYLEKSKESWKAKAEDLREESRKLQERLNELEGRETNPAKKKGKESKQ